MNKLLLSVVVTAVVYCGSLLPVFARPQISQTTDDSFVSKAIETNLAEIELGKMAESKSDDPRIQAYAAMLVKDHTNALNRLHRMMSGDMNAVPSTDTTTDTPPSYGAVVLSKQHQELRDRLSQLSGADFDTAYLDAMIDEHRKDIREFEGEAQPRSDKTDETSDSLTVQKPEPEPATRNDAIARELLSTMRMDLQQALDLQQKSSGSTVPQNNSDGDVTPQHEKTK